MVESGDPMIAKELFNKVGVFLYQMLSEGDDRIQFDFLATRSVSGPSIAAYNPNGKYERPDGRINSVRSTRELTDAMKELRAAHYRVGSGTWFSARIVVTKDAAATAEYNYTDEPDWGSAAAAPTAYLDDQEVFPRSEDKQPDWLKKKLAEGRAMIAAKG